MLRNDEQTSLIVDGVSQSSTTKGKEFQFGKFATNSDVYVGGMPNWLVIYREIQNALSSHQTIAIESKMQLSFVKYISNVGNYH